jgi:hypothetical protein
MRALASLNPYLLDIPDGMGVNNDAGTWVDASIANSALVGLLVLVVGLWGLYLVNRLWQLSLAEQCAAAIDAAGARGLALRRGGLRARIVAVGTVGAERVRVEWRGGVLGTRSVVIRADLIARGPLIESEAALDDALHRIGAT